MGPGSPTYAVRQLADSLAWHRLIARHRVGATLALASAAVIAISALALPVYEIYKAGQDLHWQPGLDLFGAYGLKLVFVPHWNNAEGAPSSTPAAASWAERVSTSCWRCCRPTQRWWASTSTPPSPPTWTPGPPR